MCPAQGSIQIRDPDCVQRDLVQFVGQGVAAEGKEGVVDKEEVCVGCLPKG